MSTKSRWVGGYLEFYDDARPLETTDVMAPVKLFDDFLGNAFNKYVANENTTSLWRTTETNLNTAIALVADAVNGAVQITIDADDNAEVGFIGFADNECLSLSQGLIWECRATWVTLPTGAGGELTPAL